MQSRYMEGERGLTELSCWHIHQIQAGQDSSQLKILVVLGAKKIGIKKHGIHLFMIIINGRIHTYKVLCEWCRVPSAQILRPHLLHGRVRQEKP
jgi:hypothetical protein